MTRFKSKTLKRHVSRHDDRKIVLSSKRALERESTRQRKQAERDRAQMQRFTRELPYERLTIRTLGYDL